MSNWQFKSIYSYHKSFTEGVKKGKNKPFYLLLIRSDSEKEVFKTDIYQDDTCENVKYLTFVMRTMLWAYGGYEFRFFGDAKVSEKLIEIYEGSFDCEFMEKVYKKKMQFKVSEEAGEFVSARKKTAEKALKTSGKRIGFDAGGSDRKVTAVLDGTAIYENETIWHPKLNADPEYHIRGIKDSIDEAYSKLGGEAGSIGVSTAGIVIDNELRVSSLFRKVSEEEYQKKVLNVYKDLEKTYRCEVNVANDGDIAALAGALRLQQGKVLGTAMGTSLAGGYIDEEMKITGYLNELAFVPVDTAENAPIDEWSGNRGTGVMYHSQDAVIFLAEKEKIDLSSFFSPAEKLKEVQKLLNKEDARAVRIFVKMGEFYGHTLMWLKQFYPLSFVFLLGRVASGKGGDIILEKAQEFISNEGGDITVLLPGEMERRLGQSYAASMI